MKRTTEYELPFGVSDGEAREARRVAAELRAKCRHLGAVDATTWPYREQTYTFARRENRKAWGGVVQWERCRRCRAVRVSLFRGTEAEQGSWRDTE